MLAWLVIAIAAVPAGAGVVVISNRTAKAVTLLVAPHDGKVTLPPGEVVPLVCEGGLLVSLPAKGERQTFHLKANAPFFVREDDAGKLHLGRIGLGGDSAEDYLPMGSLIGAAHRPALRPAPASRVTIPVKILVDEDEPTKREIWEKRLRARVQAASDIIERHCFVRLQVVAVDTWQSDNAISNFDNSFLEFIRKVDPAPARLAIGFTSQYRLTVGRTHMGGTRGPLDTHILLREWSPQATETERLELLTHELGHFLGAAHSPEPGSLMRAILFDKKARARAFPIQFDPLSSLAMCLVGEELRTKPNARLTDLSLDTQLELARIYLEIRHALPDDPAAPMLLGMIDRGRLLPLVLSTQLVVRTIVAAAERNATMPEPAEGVEAAPVEGSTASSTLPMVRLSGDALGELYIRQAASVATRLPPDVAPKAFLFGMAIALDRTDTIRKHPLAGSLCVRLESEPDRKHRLEVLGKPAARGREDLLEHFVISAGLTGLLGPFTAESVGLLKEQQDSYGGTGFSLVDYQADLAGIAFGKEVLSEGHSLGSLRSFRWGKVLPDQTGLVEGLTHQAFVEQFGSLADPRFLAARAMISGRVKQLSTALERPGAAGPSAGPAR
jgi:hypothetical protein